MTHAELLGWISVGWISFGNEGCALSRYRLRCAI
jgi:hypothetical protein